MNKIMTSLKTIACASLLALPTASFADEAPDFGNIRVVIGSKSTGGDTYQVSSIISSALADKLDTNVKVDAVGSSAAFKALKRVKNGSTIMIFHDQSYLGKLYGKRGYYDIFDDFVVGPTFAINPGNAYLAPKNSKFNNVEDVVEAAGNGQKIRVAIQPGGVSEIGYSAMKNAVKLKYPGKEGNVVAINTGSQSDKNQQLFDGLADVIQGSVQANEQYTRLDKSDQKAMKFLWLTARKETIEQTNKEGLGATTREDLLEYVTPNVQVPMDATTEFTFDKEFFFLYNKKTDPKIIAHLDKVLAEIFEEGVVDETMKKSFFIPNFKPSPEAQVYLKNKNDQYSNVIKSMQ
ncbi:hypothetical protein L4D76_22475 [Photobacterium sagamiensis]|uniref:hypothetical protein n=1 Tax=Photobacterium sagamiensis TaxID=2910241 RepID=UPI003D0D0C4D